jgi:tyrosyl-tRNA synthetase
VQIGDPSGRTTARTAQEHNIKALNVKIMGEQLRTLWTNVKSLSIKHQYPQSVGGQRTTLNNIAWLRSLGAIDLLRTVGSGMRLGSMLARDS